MLRGAERQQAGVYREALLELKLGIKEIKEAIVATGRELEAEQVELATADRRGKLARDIGDHETADIAVTFVEKHRQRVAVLERKLGVQQDELAIAEREYEELSVRYRSAKQGFPADPDLTPRDPSQDDGVLKARMDRKAAEAAVEAQLEMLKKKLGRQ